MFADIVGAGFAIYGKKGTIIFQKHEIDFPLWKEAIPLFPATESTGLPAG